VAMSFRIAAAFVSVADGVYCKTMDTPCSGGLARSAEAEQPAISVNVTVRSAGTSRKGREFITRDKQGCAIHATTGEVELMCICEIVWRDGLNCCTVGGCCVGFLNSRFGRSLR
jgi:hypothetical protein